jgi:hypothetical protein
MAPKYLCGWLTISSSLHRCVSQALFLPIAVARFELDILAKSERFVSNLGIHGEFAIVTGILVDQSRWLGGIASLYAWMTGVLPIDSANMQPNRRSAA